jgi:hypothetical protein
MWLAPTNRLQEAASPSHLNWGAGADTCLWVSAISRSPAPYGAGRSDSLRVRAITKACVRRTELRLPSGYYLLRMPPLATCSRLAGPLATLSIGQLQPITTSTSRRAPDSRDDDFRIFPRPRRSAPRGRRDGAIFEFRFLADCFRRSSVPTLSQPPAPSGTESPTPVNRILMPSDERRPMLRRAQRLNHPMAAPPTSPRTHGRQFVLWLPAGCARGRYFVT